MEKSIGKFDHYLPSGPNCFLVNLIFQKVVVSLVVPTGRSVVLPSGIFSPLGTTSGYFFYMISKTFQKMSTLVISPKSFNRSFLSQLRITNTLVAWMYIFFKETFHVNWSKTIFYRHWHWRQEDFRFTFLIKQMHCEMNCVYLVSTNVYVEKFGNRIN